jgi:hypothetical protein
MVSLVRRGGKLPFTAFALTLAIWIFSSSAAMAQRGGHAGGGVGGMGHMGGFRHNGFGAVGGFGFYPGSYGPGDGSDGLGYGIFSVPYYGVYGTGYGYPYYGFGSGYGYPSTYYNTRFVAPALGFGY